MKNHSRTVRQAVVSLDELAASLAKVGIVIPADARVQLLEPDGEQPRRLQIDWTEESPDQDVDLPSLLSK